MPVRRPASLWSDLVDLVFPPKCEVCLADCRVALCEGCVHGIASIVAPYCRRCNVPFPESETDRVFCGDCRASRGPLAAVRSVGLHLGPLRDAVLRLKFGGARRLAPALASLIYDRVLREADEPDGLPLHEVQALAPAALHPRRRRWRGFDQAGLMAGHLARLWGLPAMAALRRTRFTAPQVELEREERHRNVHGAFEVVPGAEVEGLVVAVLDDVYTTGATLEACAAALRKAGAARVYGLTVTRAAPPWHPAATANTARGA